MNLALKRLAWQIYLVCLDDIVIWSTSLEDHLNRLRAVFERLKEAQLKLKPAKCVFLQRQFSFLGHVVSSEGIHTDLEKTRSVREWPSPKNVSELRSFLGLLSYYRRFFHNFAVKAEPLLRVTRTTSRFQWKEEKENAFSELKSTLVQPTVLAYPNFGAGGGLFILDTDAGSGYGIVAELELNGVEPFIDQK